MDDLKCPVCDSPDTVYFSRVRDHFLSGEVFELYRCTACGVIYTRCSHDEKSMGRYYNSDEYISHNDSAKGTVNRLYRLSRKMMLKKKCRLVREITGINTGSLLDIGSGAGHFLHELAVTGWSVKGIEVNERARELSSSRFSIEILHPSASVSLPSGSFDCITLWHSLEHLHDPVSWAREIHRLLRPGGKCVAALPNCSSFDARHYGEFWAAYDVPRHLWHFTPSAFNAFAEKTGFRLSAMPALPLDVFYIASLSEKYKGSSLYFIKGLLKGTWFTLRTLSGAGGSSSLVYILTPL